MWGGSTSHPVKKLYIGVDGVSKKIKRGYIGDANGKARLFYNSAYRWERYTIETVMHYKLKHDPNNNVTFYLNYSFPTTIPNFYYSNNHPTTLDISTGGFKEQNGSDLNVTRAPNSKVGMWVYAVYPGGTPPDRFTFLQKVISVSSTEIKAGESYEIVTDYTEQLKGTYVDTVENENPSAYPDNGVSGDYWYVKIS